jgi:hypothetical protein
MSEYILISNIDADLVGEKGRLVMQFEDGSAIEVRPDDVIEAEAEE